MDIEGGHYQDVRSFSNMWEAAQCYRQGSNSFCPWVQGGRTGRQGSSGGSGACRLWTRHNRYVSSVYTDQEATSQRQKGGFTSWSFSGLEN